MMRVGGINGWLAGARASKPLIGVFWMVLAGLSFVTMTGIVRSLGTDIPAAQSAFLRFAWGGLFLAPALWRVLKRGMSAQVWQLQLGRGVVHTGAVILWFYAMARLPVAEVTAINFLNPVLVSLGAVALFGERLTVARIVLTGVAFCGVLIVLRPGLRAVEAGHLAQLIAAFGFAASYLFAKRLSGLIDATAVVAGLSGLVTLGLLPFAIMVWQPVSVMQLAFLALVACFATAGHYAMTRAFAVAPMAVTQPVVFLQLVWASALGMLVFDEALDRFVLIGGAVIIGAISLQAALEHRREKRR